MVAKTKDINFDSLNFVDGKISQSAKGKTAVYFSEVTKDDVADSISMQIKDGKLEKSIRK